MNERMSGAQSEAAPPAQMSRGPWLDCPCLGRAEGPWPGITSQVGSPSLGRPPLLLLFPQHPGMGAENAGPPFGLLLFSSP